MISVCATIDSRQDQIFAIRHYLKVQYQVAEVEIDLFCVCIDEVKPKKLLVLWLKSSALAPGVANPVDPSVGLDHAC